MRTPDNPHTPTSTALRRRGLLSVFGSTLFQLCGVFMLSPLVLLLLSGRNVSSTVAGLFAAVSWLGIFLMTPFASSIVRRWGHRKTVWLASSMPLLAVAGFWTTDLIWVWFVLELFSGMTGSLRWMLAESLIAEFAPPEHLGRYMGMFATMVGLTFILGPSLLAWTGANTSSALATVLALLGIGLAWTAYLPTLPSQAAAPNVSNRPTQVSPWSAVSSCVAAVHQCGCSSESASVPAHPSGTHTGHAR